MRWLILEDYGFLLLIAIAVMSTKCHHRINVITFLLDKWILHRILVWLLGGMILYLNQWLLWWIHTSYKLRINIFFLHRRLPWHDFALGLGLLLASLTSFASDHDALTAGQLLFLSTIRYHLNRCGSCLRWLWWSCFSILIHALHTLFILILGILVACAKLVLALIGAQFNVLVNYFDIARVLWTLGYLWFISFLWWSCFLAAES